MRKWYMIAASLIACLLVGAGAAAASADTEVSLSASRSVVAVGDRFDVTVRLGKATDTAGLSFELKYDPSKVKLVQEGTADRIEYGAAFSYFGGATASKTKGTVRLPVMVKDPLAGIGAPRDAVTVTFEVLAEGSAKFELQQVELSTTGSLLAYAHVQGKANVIAAEEELTPPGGPSGTFDVRSAVFLTGKVRTFQWDLNGDNVTDRHDLAVLLRQVEPVTFSK